MLREITVLHLEPTDVCQASCALCARETDVNFNKNLKHHLNMHMITQVFDTARIAKLDKMFMCGIYGDPAAGKHTLEIYREFRRLNPEITLGMNTNGALQNTAWWQELGSMFNNPKDYVVFSIDGLEDTNSIYRQGVDWHRLMSNVQAFVSAGGSAHWDMLAYRHNQHQVEQCKALAQQLGFKWFRVKVSGRPLVNGLQAPIGWQQNLARNGPISCHALNEKSAYIDAQGRMSPCCWLGARQQDFINDIETVKLSWNTPDCNPVCKATCTQDQTGSKFTNQWRQEIQLQQQR